MTTTFRDQGLVRDVDITSFKTYCPLPTSQLQAVLRSRSMNTSIRQLMKVTILDEEWRLKQQCVIQTTGRVFNHNTSLLGSDVAEVDPRRFIRMNVRRQSKSKDPT